jgi:hypothetical protein
MMVKMDSRRRIAELTRMQMIQEAKPAPIPASIVRAGVSKVPPPKPIVEAVSDNSGDMDLHNDKLDNQTWSKLWDKRYLGKRTA